MNDDNGGGDEGGARWFALADQPPLNTQHPPPQAATNALDAMAVKAAVVGERLRALLSSKDKKAHILGMVERNEIDAPLMALLAQNIAAARAGGQDDAVKFMETIKGALAKYLVTKVKAVA